MTRSKTLVTIGAVLAVAGVTTAAVGYGAGSSSAGPGSSYSVTPYSTASAAPTTSGPAGVGSSKRAATTPSASKPASPSTASSPPAAGAPTGSAAAITGVARPSGSPSRVYVITGGGTTIVDASLTPTYVDSHGILAPAPKIAGWYANAGWAKPGYVGAAILVGHITFNGVPDTFYQLPRAAPGDSIVVRYTSGQQTVFTVTRSAAESKKAVPEDTSIWAASSPSPLLRLITCDPTTPVRNGHFQGNWVVWARPA